MPLYEHKRTPIPGGRYGVPAVALGHAVEAYRYERPKDVNDTGLDALDERVFEHVRELGESCSVVAAEELGVAINIAQSRLRRLERLGKLRSERRPWPGTGQGRRWFRLMEGA